MAYSLGVRGLSDFARIDGAFAQRKISRDPLSGVVDGSNKIFHTNYAPILSSGSVAVYVGANALSGTYDADTGEVTTGSAPAVQPVATYTFTPYTLSQRLSFLIAGFWTLESEWPRGWKVVDASGAEADENSAVLYVQDSSSNDPLTNAPYQVAAYMAACRYTYLLTLLTGAAITDYSWRETIRGMSVDKSKRPSNLTQAVEQAYQAMKRAIQNAQDKFYTDGAHLGAFVGSPMTEGYVYGLEWQDRAISDDNRGQRGSLHLISLTV